MTTAFGVGRVETTDAARAALAVTGVDLLAILLARHQRGDWGEVDESTREANENALAHGRQVRSTYRLPDGTELMVHTNADRSVTRVLLAEEFEHREVGLREGYAAWASVYDQEKNPLISVEQPRVDAILAALPIANALDVGTGTGRHALALARRGVKVTAIDQSPEMLTVGQRAAERAGLAITWRRAALEDGLPFAASRFDFVICALMLCHLPQIAPLVREFARVLQPGGHLLITDFHPDIVAHGWRTQFSQPGTTYLFPDEPHTREEYLDALAAAGLTLLQAIDVPVDATPEGYLHPARRRESADIPFCLILLVQKPAVHAG